VQRLVGHARSLANTRAKGPFAQPDRHDIPLQSDSGRADGSVVTTPLIHLRQRSGVASPFLFLVIAVALLAMS